MAKGGYRGGMGGGMNMNMIKQAKKMKKDMLKMQEELESKEYDATAGGGMVKAVVNGKHELLSLSIHPEAVDPGTWRCCRIWLSRRSMRQCERQRPKLRRICRS